MYWGSSFNRVSNLPKWCNFFPHRFVIQTWVESFKDLPQQLLAKGYKLIISTKNAWYLDHGFWGRTVYYRWTKVYDNRLPSRDDGVYGGEVCMWGEYVDDAAIDSRIWPRASAAGERMWSNPVNGSSDAVYRFLSHRERLVRLGIKAEAVTPEWCNENEDSCRGYIH